MAKQPFKKSEIKGKLAAAQIRKGSRVKVTFSSATGEPMLNNLGEFDGEMGGNWPRSLRENQMFIQVTSNQGDWTEEKLPS